MKDNKLIAEFMGANTSIESEDVQSYEMYGVLECIEDGISEKHFFLPEEMRFHTSWDWLMPVVCKIDDLFGEDDDVNDRINKVHNAVLQFDMEIVHRAVVEFITDK